MAAGERGTMQDEASKASPKRMLYGVAKLAVLLIWGCIPAVVFVLLFSSLGYGLEIYHALSSHLLTSQAVALGAPLVAVVAWFIGAERAPVFIQVILLLPFTACALVATGLAQRQMPAAPLGIYAVLLPVWASCLYGVVEARAKKGGGEGEARLLRDDEFFHLAAKISLAVSALLLGASCAYNLPTVAHNDAAGVMKAMRPVLECQPGGVPCGRPYIMWAFPVLLAVVHLVYYIFVSALAGATDRSNTAAMMLVLIGLSAGLVWVGAEVAAANVHLAKVISMFALALSAGIFIVFAMYARRLSGFERSSQDEASRRGSWEQRREQLEDLKEWERKSRQTETGAWIWGFICFTPMPWLFAVYVAADWVRTKVHRSCSCARRTHAQPVELLEDEDEDDKHGAQRLRAERMAYPWASPWLAGKLAVLFGVPHAVRQRAGAADPEGAREGAPSAPQHAPQHGPQHEDGLNWSSILSKAIVISLAFLLVNVGIGKATMLVLSALIAALRGVNLGIVVIVFVVVGVLMFMLPPVPGIPVYLTGGLVITSSARHVFGYGPALGLAIVASFSLKLLAVFIQQEGIGRFLAGHVAVRKAVGVNSEQTRAIKRILQQPGLTIPKVSILVGGPDWPTSVLAGILRINVWQCLLGTLPVIIIIAPQCAVGAFEGDDPPVSQQVSNLFLLFASVMAMLPLGAAMYFINAEIRRGATPSAAGAAAGGAHAAEHVEPEPLDMEVLSSEKAEAMSKALYRVGTHWRRELFTHITEPVPSGMSPQERQPREIALEEKLPPMPLSSKLVLIFGWLCASLSVLLVGMFDDHCFQEFDITDSIEEKLGGNPANVVHPMGWIALGLNVLSLVAWWSFGRWGKAQVSRLEKSGVQPAGAVGADGGAGAAVSKSAQAGAPQPEPSTDCCVAWRSTTLTPGARGASAGRGSAQPAAAGHRPQPQMY